jgi:hypothetical protein
MKRFLSQCLALVVLMTSAASAESFTEPTLGSGRELKGPQTITVGCINVLRLRNVALVQNTTFVPPPDIVKVVFMSGLPVPKVSQPAPAPRSPAADKPTAADRRRENLDVIFSTYVDEATRLSAVYEDQVATVLANVNEAQRIRDRLVLFIDDRFASVKSGADCETAATTVLSRINAPITGDAARIEGRLQRAWPDDSVLHRGAADAVRLSGDLEEMKKAPGWDNWYVGRRKVAYDNALATAAALKTAFAAATHDQALFLDYDKRRAVLDNFSDRLASLKPTATEPSHTAAFVRSTEVVCDAHFGKGKEVAVKIVGSDDAAADRDHAAFNRDVTKVICPSPISASYGVGTAFQTERHYAIVPSKPADPTAASVNRFDTDVESAHRMLLAYLGHVRLGNGPFHVSAGPAFNFDTGVDPGLFYGLSYSRENSAYLSAGWSILRQNTLIGGFNTGDQVPSDVKTAPTRKSWQNAFTIFYTFPTGASTAVQSSGSNTTQPASSAKNGNASTTGGTADAAAAAAAKAATEKAKAAQQH